MLLMQASDTAALSGLTAHQLREWCVRRAILTPDIPPNGPGRHALYSWRAVLALRVLNELHLRFAAEVGGWAPAIQSFRRLLESRSFHSLWGTSAQLAGCENEAAIGSDSPTDKDMSGIILPLDPHLEILAQGLQLPNRVKQLPLFPATLVSGARR